MLANGFTRLTGIILIIISLWLASTEVIYGIGQFQLKQAVKLSRSGNYLLAESKLGPLDILLRKSDSYLYERGKILMALKRYPLALEKLNKATLFTSNPDLYIDIGKCNETMKHTKKAINDFKLAMYIAPNRFTPKFRLMELYRQNSDTFNAMTMAHIIILQNVKVPSDETNFYKKKAKDMILKLNPSESKKTNPFFQENLTGIHLINKNL